MTKKELIEALKEFSDNQEIMILDGFNGGGEKREINLGPFQDTIKKSDTLNSGDCQGKLHKKVIILGYGCY